MIYTLDAHQIDQLKPLVIGHTAARLIEMPSRLAGVKPHDKAVRILQADGLELGRITVAEAFSLKMKGERK